MSPWQSGTTRKMPSPTPEPAMPRASPSRALHWRCTSTTAGVHPAVATPIAVSTPKAR